MVERPVYVPCPISTCLIMTVTVLSGATRTKALGASTSLVAAAAREWPNQRNAMVSPSVARAAPCRKRRRSVRVASAIEGVIASAFHDAGCLMDGSADADIGGAAT